MSIFRRLFRIADWANPCANRGISKHLYLRGSIVSLWAGIESALDRANHAMAALSDKPLRTRLPRNFHEKVIFFEKAQANTPLISSFERIGQELARRILLRIEDRHFLVHGYTLVDQNDSRTCTLRKHRLSKASIDDEDRVYTVEDLQNFNEESLKLSNDWADYLRDLTAILLRLAQIENEQRLGQGLKRMHGSV